MNLACPDCNTVYRIDPARVPEAGAATRCRECGTHFRADGPDTSIGVARVAERVEERVEAPAAERVEAPVTERVEAPADQRAPAFGPQDPDTRAKRLARALVSDIVVYNRDRWEKSRDAGSLRTDFREEIMKSWEEYVQQVGNEMAKGTPYFREALNAILAEGQRVF